MVWFQATPSMIWMVWISDLLEFFIFIFIFSIILMICRSWHVSIFYCILPLRRLQNVHPQSLHSVQSCISVKLALPLILPNSIVWCGGGMDSPWPRFTCENIHPLAIVDCFAWGDFLCTSGGHYINERSRSWRVGCTYTWFLCKI